MNKISHLALQDLILIRFLTSSDVGLTISELKKSLGSFFYHSPSSNEWLHELQQLAVNGALQKIGKSRFQTTAEGRKLALQKLGLHSLLPETRWLTLKNCYLVATVLGLPAPTKERDRQCIASADGLRASILANTFQLSTDAYPSLTKARDSLLWQQLTDITVTAKLREKLAASNDIYFEPFTTGSIIALLLKNLLGNERELSWKSALKQLVAKSVRARRINPEELRLAILKKATEKPSLAFLAKQFDLEDFAKQVMKSANRCQTGRFGDNQIFISFVWRQMELDDNQFGLDINQFKYYLTLANNKGLIRLSRADLPYAMDQDAVSASETPYLNSIFHFIRLEP